MLGMATEGVQGGPPPAMQSPAFSLTLANARLSLSLLRMCRKASWVPKVRLQTAVRRMRKAWVIGKAVHLSLPPRLNCACAICPPFFSLALSAAHALRKCLPVCALQREEGGAGARLRGGLGRGRAPARCQPTAGGPTSTGATPPLVSAPE